MKKLFKRWRSFSCGAANECGIRKSQLLENEKIKRNDNNRSAEM
jgi:hypothetical protein